MYASFAFSLAHFSKMGFIFYLLALTINSMTGWSLDVVIIGVGIATVFYTLIGGLEAVIWTTWCRASCCGSACSLRWGTCCCCRRAGRERC